MAVIFLALQVACALVGGWPDADVVGYRRAVDPIEALELPHRGEAVEDKLTRLS